MLNAAGKRPLSLDETCGYYSPMGLQDRDWYWEAKAEKERAAQRAKPAKRIPIDLDNANPPKLWGADWHWSLKLLVWLCIAVLLLAAARLLR